MKQSYFLFFKTDSVFIVLILVLLMPTAFAQNTAKITLQLDKPGVSVSPQLYGLMTEEINYSYDGGLYAELIRNRTFKDNLKEPEHWALIQTGEGKGTVSLDRQQPVDTTLNVSLKLNIENLGKRVAIANDGFWGVPVKPGTTYRGSFYAKTSNTQQNTINVAIESTDGTTTYASAQVNGVNNNWKRYSFTLTTGKNFKATANTRFVIAPKATGSFWFNLVSLFPPTYNNRPNGTRIDIMQLLSNMKPAFLRLPGGNYLEGQMFSTRFDWKKTLGNIDHRPGHRGPWTYRSSDGMGLLELLEWCEDLKMEPVLALFAGLTLSGDYLEAGPLLKPFVDDALEEIEYVTGDVNTKWGAKRAQDGHPEPFKVTYVEIGNEDSFDISGSYEGRYNQFSDAIRAKYPQLKLISTVGGKDPFGSRFKTPARTPEVLDEHYYRNASEMEEDASRYDSYDRKGPKIFVGEWATREGDPTTNMNAALGDAAWMTGMERNSDLVIMSCYAPLFVNVNPGGMQWKSNLIGYNSLTSYGSPSYYVQKIFNTYLGDKVVPVSAENIPTQLTKLSKRDSTADKKQKTIPAMFYVATKNSASGSVYLKIVNATGQAQPININLKGVAKVASAGSKVVIKADKPEDTNTITEPQKIIPITSKIKGLGTSFTQTFPAYSVTVLQLETK